jgi:thiol-disulfide isomerase/thioredoxin
MNITQYHPIIKPVGGFVKKVCVSLAFFILAFEVVSAQTTVKGTLLGHDGKPMPKANVILMTTMQDSAVKIADADKKGKYRITVDSAGVWMLVFAGVNHSSHQVALYVDEPKKITLNIRLKTYDYLDSLDAVKIDGDFNHFNMQTANSMEKQSDGTFLAEFNTKADSFAYEIVGVTKDGHTINGTQSERYVYDSGGDFISIITPVNGLARIIFDPFKLVKSDKPFKAAFAESRSLEARFAGIYEEMMKELDDYRLTASAYVKSGKDMRRFNYDSYWYKEVESITRKLGEEKNPVLRQELYLNYFWLALFNAKLEGSVVQDALREIPPSSVVWSLIPNSIMPAGVERFAGLPAEEQDKYAERVLEENPVAGVKAQLLYTLCEVARHGHDSTKAATYYDMLVNKYGNTEPAKMAKVMFSPNLRVAVGKPVPAFSIASLEDSTKIFSDQSFKGKYYMIDFWATWCGPCVAEMESLHKAYARFKDKNFMMLSVSLDGSPQDVAKFRSGKWQMPWLQAFGGQAWDSKIVKDFEVVGIPRPVLIDTTGKIVAMEDELRGENLEKTLEKYLGK